MTALVLLTPQQAAAFLDHTLLAPDATAQAVEALCAEAVAHGFKAVCVNPWHVPRVVARLTGELPLPITVVGFPLGASQTAAKAREAGLAVDQGAAEVDMVLNIGALKGGDTEAVRQDVAEVVRACAGRPVKVILETCLLSDAEKELACRLCVEAGAAFVKTSTGFSRAGATEADVALMRRVVGPHVGVKASGGIRCAADLLRMLAAGADRIGASAGVAIVQEFSQAGGSI
jgi:deoxyribose-phosphate aldolase